MRIIPDCCPTLRVDSGTIYGKQFGGAVMTFYGEPDTIEITDEEWDEIWLGYEQESIGQGFSKYLRGLLELKEGK